MTTNNFCFYLQNRPIQTGQTGGQRYSDTSPFSIPWLNQSSSLGTVLGVTKFIRMNYYALGHTLLGCSVRQSVTKLIKMLVINFGLT